jgi:hypothetical protein
LGFGVWGLGFGVKGFGKRHLAFDLLGLRGEVKGLWYWVRGSGFGDED